jgi:hypothetical protein
MVAAASDSDYTSILQALDKIKAEVNTSAWLKEN